MEYSTLTKQLEKKKLFEISVPENIEKNFQDLFEVDEFLEKVSNFFKTKGFDKKNSLSCISTCRDENTSYFKKKIQEYWGDCFDISGLAGCLSCGSTAFQAFSHHVPIDETKKERYLIFAFAHVAISKEGEIGICYRPGIKEKSNACGALCGTLKQFKTPNFKLEENEDDNEFVWLKKRILKVLDIKNEKIVENLDLIQLTKIVEKIIEEDVEKNIHHIVGKKENVEVGVCIGTQIHTNINEENSLISPRIAYHYDFGTKKKTEFDFS